MSRLKHSVQGSAVQLHCQPRALLQHCKPVRLADCHKPAVRPEQRRLRLHRGVPWQAQQPQGAVIRCSQQAAPAGAWMLRWHLCLMCQLLGSLGESSASCSHTSTRKAQDDWAAQMVLM